MTDNQIIDKFSTQEDLSPKLASITKAICERTGFVLGEELHRRFIYEKDKTWRVKYAGTYQEKPAVLLILGMKLEEDEEGIRKAFREQTIGSRIRPPETYIHESFDEAKGFGFTIEERVDGPMLYKPDEDPAIACKAFVDFYRELRSGVTKPFWANEHASSAKEFSMKQFDKWEKLAEEKTPGVVGKMKPFLDRLRYAVAKDMEARELRFMHPHLCGPDVRHGSKNDYVVFVNHFWAWRQPSYDLAFPIWHQWMHQPVDKRRPADIQTITDTWMALVKSDLSDLVDENALRATLLNRVFGSLILDLPAKAKLEPESNETVAPLYQAFVAEGERLLAV